MSAAISQFIETVRRNQRKGMAVAEIGVWGGNSAVEWMPIVEANGGSGILVDYFHGNPTASGPEAFSESRRDDIYCELQARMRPFSNVRILEGDSAEMAALVKDKTLDVCFIDADHRYSKVSLDIAAWLPKIRPGGIIGGHDFDDFSYEESKCEMDADAGVHHGVAKAVLSMGIPFTAAHRCWWTVV